VPRTLWTSLFLAGCVGPSAGFATNAALNTAIAGGAAGYSRAHGGCYAVCPVGTTCNSQTGYCDELPCRGFCAADEACDSRGLIPHCVRADTVDIVIEGKPDRQTTPAVPDPQHPL
jgi:hypothetical protein